MSLAELENQEERTLLWTPPPTRVQSSDLHQFQLWLTTNRGISTTSYRSLQEWSVENLEDFWSGLWEYFDVLCSEKPDAVLQGTQMPDFRWFPGSRLNYAENILRHANLHGDKVALIGLHETGDPKEISWIELRSQVASLSVSLRNLGVKPGDTVAAVLPNIAETVVAFLACASVGAIWSVVSPDFGVTGILDRFEQIKPKALFVVDGYEFKGTSRHMAETTNAIMDGLPTVEHLIVIEQIPQETTLPATALQFSSLAADNVMPEYEQVPFGHPLWVVYSSGTTGAPKGIVHSHGGVVLETLKAARLQYDIQPGDRCYFAVSTTWVLWNMLVGTMGAGASIVTYDGSPTHQGDGKHFEILARTGATFFGTGSGILSATEKSGFSPIQEYDLSSLRTILSTGSPLPMSTWSWVYEHVNSDVKLGVVSGGTDVATSFLIMNPLDPVYAGELQGAALGVDAQAWNTEGERVINEVGELVITRPMPSMPINLWNDPYGEKYRRAYFETFPKTWMHGDWISETTDGRFVVHGRSDATINRGGIRMGSADISRVVDEIDGVVTSMVIGAELADGEYYMPMFVVLEEHQTLTDELRDHIIGAIRDRVSPRYVPDEIIQAPGVPTTRTGKLMEVPVKRLFQGSDTSVVNRSAASDGPVLDWYIARAADFTLAGSAGDTR